MIEGVTAVPDYTATSYGLPNVSLLVQTSQRQIKLTAPTLEKHDAWFEVNIPPFSNQIVLTSYIIVFIISIYAKW